MQSYLNLLKTLVTRGVEKGSGRKNMPNVYGITHYTIEHNLSEGFPLLTTKKMYYRGIINELLWFLRGETNIKWLLENKVRVWTGDAYRWYQKQCKDRGYENEFKSIDEFAEAVKNSNYDCPAGVEVSNWVDGHWDNQYKLGDLGKVYGYQWRNQNGVDQIRDILTSLTENPESRYHILDGWNKSDFKDMALPPCHLLYQFIIEPKEDGSNFYLDLNMYQRSVDSFLGCPFNIASMSLLNMIIANATGHTARNIFWIGGDTHYYKDHREAIDTQLSRTPYDLPTMIIKRNLKGDTIDETLKNIESLTLEDFELVNYKHQPEIKAELFTGYED